MVDKYELRRISLIQDMPDKMLDLLGEAGELKIFSDGTTLFSQGQVLDKCYMVLSGTVLLEVKPVQDVIITLDSLGPGTCFALSSLIPDSVSQNSAVCGESCELLCLPAQKLREIFAEHTDLGYQFMYRITAAFKERMEHRTSLFLRVLQNHPDLKELFSE
ncbi:MAG: Crp/Fnr family transcriptional regulator [Desulfonatronovibrionaceae bacterium]